MGSHYPRNVFFKILLIFSVVVVNGQQKEYRHEEISERSGFWDKIVPTNLRKLFSHDEKTKNNASTHKAEPYYDYGDQKFPNYDNSRDYHDAHAYRDDIFPAGENREEQKATGKKDSTPEDRKEHGRLDFIGRDIIKEVSKGIDKIEKKLGLKSSSKGLDVDKKYGGFVDTFKDRIKAIYPGTKWCGDGNRAANKEDFGTFEDTDKCCRNHDKCPNAIASGQVKNGLENTGLFTRSHCDCDEQFHDCLRSVGSLVSKKIGFTYFTVLGPQCFREVPCSRGEYCQRTGRDSYGVEYEWFDNPKF